MTKISRKEVIMPGGIEMLLEAENYMMLDPDCHLLSVACGTGELELYLAEKYGCHITGIDSGKGFIERAQEKTLARKLQEVAKFEVGDGNNLKFEPSSFDVVFCSGALCAFFLNGLKEFHRVLMPHGIAVITDVVWRKNAIPKEIDDCWSGGSAHILTRTANSEAFADAGFQTVFSKEYHEPSWWDAYYEDRGHAQHWQEERDHYLDHQDYIGLGLFVIEKE